MYISFIQLLPISLNKNIIFTVIKSSKHYSSKENTLLKIMTAYRVVHNN